MRAVVRATLSLLAAALFLAYSTRVLPAQDVSGHLEGRVRDSGGAPLPEVEVLATSPSLMGTRSALTDQAGRFRLYALPVGVYRVALRRIGHRPVVIEHVPVQLGATASLPGIVLAPAGPVAMPELVVTAEDAGIDPASTAQQTILDGAALAALPLERNFRGILNLAADATPSFLGDEVNVGGGTGLENSYFVDGINVTSPLNGATSMDLPYNFIQQIELRSGGATADVAQSMGGTVNVVTPTGGNRFRAQVFAHFSGDGLQGTPRSVAGATETGFSLFDVGGSIGGPIARDRLWFFVAWNPTYERHDHAYSFGRLRDTRLRHLFAGKLTWQTGINTTATLTILGDPAASRGVQLPLFTTGQLPLNPEVVATSGEGGGTGMSLRVQHAVTPRLHLESSVARMARTDTQGPASAAGEAPAFIDFVSGVISGGHGHRERFRSARTSVGAAAGLSLAAHTLKAGIEYEVLYGDLAVEGSRQTSGSFVQRVDTSKYVWFEFAAQGRIRNEQPVIFIQDAWQLSRRLLVSAGLRWSRQHVVNGESDSLLHRVRDGLQPRLSVAFQPGRIGSQRVFASYARVADQLAVWSAQSYGPGYYCSTEYPQDPRVDTSGAITNFCFAGYTGPQGERELRGLTSDEWSVGYEAGIGRRFTLAARVTRRSIVSAVEDGFDSTGTLYWGNPGRGGLAGFPRATRTFSALEVTLRGPSLQVSYLWSRARGNYTGLYATDLRVATAHNGPQFDFPEQLVGGSGLMPNDRTHVFKVFASRRLGSQGTVGVSLLLASGTPLSEYGGIPAGPPYWGFASTRGTAGRTSPIWDLGIRAAYQVPLGRRAPFGARALLDLQHLGSPRRAVDYDQVHFTCAANDQSCANASYRTPTRYQPPMTGRIGLILEY